jgi:hypothetical protein
LAQIFTISNLEGENSVKGGHLVTITIVIAVEIVEMTAVEVGNKQMVSFEEPLMSQVVQQEALTRLLVGKGIFTKELVEWQDMAEVLIVR